MIGWLRREAACPVSQEEKHWIEQRFTWLINEFGHPRLSQGELILPTTEYFPGSYQATQDEVQHLLSLVARYMGIDPAGLQLGFYQDDRPRFEGVATVGTSGLYAESDSAYQIWLEATRLSDPLNVVATIAHELGHVMLLGQRRVSEEERDHEELADLITVFFGMGLVTANSVLQEANWSDGVYTGWSVGRNGYMTMNMYGYALAIYGLSRSEEKPAWLRYLRGDVRSACKSSLAYIRETGDCDVDLPGFTT